MPSNGLAVTVELVVLVVAALASAKLAEALDELDCLDLTVRLTEARGPCCRFSPGHYQRMSLSPGARHGTRRR